MIPITIKVALGQLVRSITAPPPGMAALWSRPPLVLAPPKRIEAARIRLKSLQLSSLGDSEREDR